MPGIRRFTRMAMLWLLVSGSGFLGAALPPSATAGAGLSVADCVKCHKTEPADIAARGMAHKSELDCQSCHESHRPKVADNIPACSGCHSGGPHYALKACRPCHNPHAPLDISFRGVQKDPCLSCHKAVYQLLAASKTKHRVIPCLGCHAGQHRFVPQCSGCHGLPHEAGLHRVFPRCADCHHIAHDLNPSGSPSRASSSRGK